MTPAVLGGGKVILVSMQITAILEDQFNWGAHCTCVFVGRHFCCTFISIAFLKIGQSYLVEADMRWWNSTAVKLRLPMDKGCGLLSVGHNNVSIDYSDGYCDPMSFSDSQYLEFPPQNWSLRWYHEYIETPRWVNATPHPSRWRS